MLFKLDDLREVVNESGTVVALRKGGYRFRQRTYFQERDYAQRAEDGNRPLRKPTRRNNRR